MCLNMRMLLDCSKKKDAKVIGLEKCYKTTITASNHYGLYCLHFLYSLQTSSLFPTFEVVFLKNTRTRKEYVCGGGGGRGGGGDR